jgi:hypothetical protein
MSGGDSAAALTEIAAALRTAGRIGSQRLKVAAEELQQRHPLAIAGE